ncbi:hypothetical protein ABK040_000314 [Willaertia magna]
MSDITRTTPELNLFSQGSEEKKPTRYFKLNKQHEPYCPSLPEMVSKDEAEYFLMDVSSNNLFLEARSKTQNLKRKLQEQRLDPKEKKKLKDDILDYEAVIQDTSLSGLVECTEEVEKLKQPTTRESRLQKKYNEKEKNLKREILKFKVGVAAMNLGEKNDFKFVEDFVTMTKEDFIDIRIDSRDTAFKIGVKYEVLISPELGKDDEVVKNYIYSELIRMTKLPSNTEDIPLSDE